MPHAPNILNLYSYIKHENNTTNDKPIFDKLLVFNHKGEKYLIITDSHGYLTFFKGKSDKSGGQFEFKGRLFSGIKSEILGLSRS